MRVGKFSLLALALLATPAMAAERSGFYIGGDVGQSNWNLSESDANDLTDALAGTIGGLANATIVETSTDFSDTDTTYSLFVGYQIVPWLAVEAAWMDLGNMNVESAGTYSFTTINPPPANVATGGSFDSRTEFQSSGPAVSALLMLPFMETWNVYGRLGYYMGDNELSGNYDAQDVRLGTPSERPMRRASSRTTAACSSGARASATPGISASRSGSSTPTSRTSSRSMATTRRTWSASPSALRIASGTSRSRWRRWRRRLLWRSRGCAHEVRGCGQRRRVRHGRQVSEHAGGRRVGPHGCSCDVTIRTHFAFDSAELTAEDKAELDRVATRLTELEFVGGTATGHTDSVGDEAYNQKLSERRAQAVVDYLHAKGVAAGRITAIGMGEAKPLADNATEEGRAQNRRVTIRRTDCGPAN